MNYFNILKNIKMLLVDDDEFIRDSLSIVFKIHGCAIQTAETAEEGLKVMDQQRFDVIISDLRLPGIGGLEFLKLAKASQSEALSLLITAYRDEGILSKATAIGANEYIEKPFSVESLAESLVTLTENRP